MEATVSDIPQLARLWYQSKVDTTFAEMDIEWTLEACAHFITTQLSLQTSYVDVVKEGKVIVAACGVQLSNTFVPPHMPIAHEWIWVGHGKAAVKALHACQSWAKGKGALWLVYATHNKQSSATRFTEKLNWRKLC